MCAICQSALVDPVTTTSCKHTFCRDCISRALVEKPQCPIDRSALGVVNLRDTEMLVKLVSLSAFRSPSPLTLISHIIPNSPLDGFGLA